MLERTATESEARALALESKAGEARMALEDEEEDRLLADAARLRRRAFRARRALETRQRAGVAEDELKALKQAVVSELDSSLRAILHATREAIAATEHRSATMLSFHKLQTLRSMRHAEELEQHKIAEKAHEVVRLQASAKRRAIRALHPPANEPPPPPRSELRLYALHDQSDDEAASVASGMYASSIASASAASVTEAQRGLLGGFFSGRADMRERRRAAEAAAKLAVTRMRQLALAHAMSAWLEFAATRAWRVQQLTKAFSRLRNHELFRGWNTWGEQAAERRRLLTVLARSAIFMSKSKLIRGWRGCAGSARVRACASTAPCARCHVHVH